MPRCGQWSSTRRGAEGLFFFIFLSPDVVVCCGGWQTDELAALWGRIKKEDMNTRKLDVRSAAIFPWSTPYPSTWSIGSPQ